MKNKPTVKQGILFGIIIGFIIGVPFIYLTNEVTREIIWYTKVRATINAVKNKAYIQGRIDAMEINLLDAKFKEVQK